MGTPTLQQVKMSAEDDEGCIVVTFRPAVEQVWDVVIQWSWTYGDIGKLVNYLLSFGITATREDSTRVTFTTDMPIDDIKTATDSYLDHVEALADMNEPVYWYSMQGSDTRLAIGTHPLTNMVSLSIGEDPERLSQDKWYACLERVVASRADDDIASHLQGGVVRHQGFEVDLTDPEYLEQAMLHIATCYFQPA